MQGRVSEAEAAALRQVQGKADAGHRTGGVLVQHTWPRDYHKFPKGVPRPVVVIGRSMCESQLLAASEAQACRRVDEVWVPTSWHVQVFTAAGVDASKLHVVPEAVDAAFFDPALVTPAPFGSTTKVAQKVLYKNGKTPFVFISNFKWEPRKGWDVLLGAYFSEFRDSAPGEVKLVIKSYKPSWEPGPEDLLSQIRGFARRKFGAALEDLPEVVWSGGNTLTRTALRLLYSQADVFVLPTRGEGWGLPATEAMAMQVPVIMTNFSGPLGFLRHESGYPLPVVRVDKAGFAVPCVESLKRLMRWTVDHPEEVKEKGRLARQEVLAKFSPKVVVDIMVDRVRDLLEQKSSLKL
eukprot:CAMPEP_0196599626 /NCGR_PEP_ID=MMETSP1081-20130531/94958_1 /TAXON_ID=36882 /ORGANISM="Pyramimonas amylifera, Strain CCMP720" /LENGTH=350 /DNA_ID=CAMNT_0041925409 /DNA_START=585 /DNA_END=1637 /DNA_ORIENTATION=-